MLITDKNALHNRCSEIFITENDKMDDERKQVLEEANALKKYVFDNHASYIAANQLGYTDRIIVMNFSGDIRAYVNPIVTARKTFEISRESCLSLKKEYFIPRAAIIEVTYQTTSGKIESKTFIGAAARLMQHAIDHLDGILLSDYGLEITKAFDKAPKEEQDAVINAYLASLVKLNKQFEEACTEDSEFKEANRAIDFMTKVQTGEITTIDLKEDFINGNNVEDKEEQGPTGIC